MDIVIDIETRSKINLGKCGAYRYAEDPSTDILCIAMKIDRDTPMIWVPEPIWRGLRKLNAWSLKHGYCLLEGTMLGYRILEDADMESLMRNADTVIAHNAQFEAVIWEEIMRKRLRFPPIPLEKWKCTAAKAAAHALPRDLERACSALGLEQQKDTAGKRVMMKWCKPRKQTQNNPSEWHDDPKEFIVLCRYCIQDVEAEYQLNNALTDLSEKETEIWRHDLIINSRGIYADIPAIDNIREKVGLKEHLLLDEISSITHGYVTSVRQVAKTREYLHIKGLYLPDLTKATVAEALEKPDTDLKARRILEIRQSIGKSSVAKLIAMKKRAGKDGRIRGSILYHGASTGRYAGRGIQPQNYPRDSYGSKDIEAILKHNNRVIEMVYDCPVVAASRCLRGMLRAAPGKKLFCADFSSIEAMVLAWTAGERKILNAFTDNRDLYKVTASDIYTVPYENVTAEQRQIGKTAVLALGYQGWTGAFTAIALTYGLEIEEEKANVIIRNWRKAHPRITALWRNMEMAAVNAVKTKKPYIYRGIRFNTKDNFLRIQLPSGRTLAYYDPQIETHTMYGKMKEAVSYTGVDSYANKWTRIRTYGGKLTENYVQAVARDILSESLLRLEKNGYPVCLHVHDEIIAELPVDSPKTLENFKAVMAMSPLWAEDIPLEVKGWTGLRYRKD